MRVAGAWKRWGWIGVAAGLCTAVHAEDLPAAEPLVPAAWAQRAALTPDARTTFDWIQSSDDAGRKPFAIVDKKQARVFVFHADGRLAGDSAALLGAGPGDHGTPDAAQRIASLTPAERTTPAGRFASEPGHNLNGEAIVWVDYDTAIAIHRVRPGASRERRDQRLASATPTDNRVSLGCIVVPGAFYDSVVAPLLGRSRGVVYVLPETAQPLLASLQPPADRLVAGR